MSCYCDNCYWDIKPCLNESEEIEATDCNETTEVAVTCPGFETILTVVFCTNSLDNDEMMCTSCEIMRDQQEQLEDEAAEEVIRRQLKNEEFQFMRKCGDLDGDAETSVSTEEEALTLQLAEDKKKRP